MGSMQRRVWTSAAALLTAVSLSLALSVPVLAQSGSDPYTGFDRDCSDFASQQEAQAFFESKGGPAEDPHRLDADNDGQACEDSDFDGGGGDDGPTPVGGVDSGFGPTAGPQVEGGGPTFAIGLVLGGSGETSSETVGH